MRPEHITIVPAGQGDIDGVVDVVEYLGADTYVIIDAENGAGQMTIRDLGDAAHQPGEKVGLKFAEGRTHLFDAEGLAIR